MSETGQKCSHQQVRTYADSRGYRFTQCCVCRKRLRSTYRMVSHDALVRGVADPQPGTIADPQAYAAALASGAIVELSP